MEKAQDGETRTTANNVVDADTEEGSEEAWRAEVERRIAELDAGAVETVPWEELRARLYQR